MKRQTRDEYLLHRTPNHTFPQYAHAHGLAGDLKLVEEQPKDKAAEQSAVLERVARGNKR